MKYIIQIISLLFLPLYIIAQSNTQNYILTKTYQDANASSSIDVIQYYDGLGRPVQTVQKGITPTSKDLVSLTEYDGVGREYRHWLPVTSTGSGAYVTPTTITGGSPKSYYDYDTKPYATANYEPSPLNRVTGQYGAGAAWYAGKRNDSILYQTNTTTNEVAYFYVNSSNKLVRNGYYAVNSLFKTLALDEDRKTTTEYKDKLGKVVMKRSSSDVDTYYVYNDLGQLCYVLPPLAADALTSGTFDDNSTPALAQYAYLYKYDERGNNIEKRLPGCDPIYMVYDYTNRLAMSQDGNQRLIGNWILITYDNLGRVLYTLEIKPDITIEELQMYFNLNTSVDEFSSTQVANAIPNSGYSIFSVKTFYSVMSPHNPTLQARFTATLVRVLTVNYYDNYSFTSLATNGSNLNWVTPPAGYDAQYSSAKGLLTGTRIYILDNSNTYTSTALYYDYRGQIVQSRSTNHLGGYDITYNAFDFRGKVLTTRKEHNISGQAVIPEVYTYSYDKAERLTTTNYQLNNNTPIAPFTNYKYDEPGRLVTNYRHNSTDTVSYVYNVRNWTTFIQSGAFKENLYYNTNLPTGGTAYFNGNIAVSSWTYKGTTYAYTYSYDPLNRLTNSNNSNYVGYDESFQYDKQGNIKTLLRYKDRYPIDYLTMTYSGNQVINVTDPPGSQHMASVKEYQNLSTAANKTEFYYDKNGNMTSDSDRNIVAIRYNVLNLPDTIQFSTGNQIINRYAADGRKLGTEYFTRVTNLAVPLITGQVIKQTYTINVIRQNGTAYVDNKEYTTLNGNTALTALNRVFNPEGYVTNLLKNYGAFYCYNRKDHLGNIREIWQATGYFPSATYQRTQYYPSGLPWVSNYLDSPGTQPYKYNGKEFVEMHGYDTYDYGARGYYPAIGRFTTVDPLAEKYYSISPYAYCKNDPVNYIDPNGEFSTKFGAWLYKVFNGGGQTLKDNATGEYFVSNQVKYTGNGVGAEVTRRFDWGGRSTGEKQFGQEVGASINGTASSQLMELSNSKYHESSIDMKDASNPVVDFWASIFKRLIPNINPQNVNTTSDNIETKPQPKNETIIEDHSIILGGYAQGETSFIDAEGNIHHVNDTLGIQRVTIYKRNGNVVKRDTTNIKKLSR